MKNLFDAELCSSCYTKCIDHLREAFGKEKEILGGADHKDEGKIDLDILPVEPIEDIAKVFMFGAKKYARHNWRGGMAWSRVVNSALRHINEWRKGINNDPESGISHLAHACVNLIFLLQYTSDHPKLDDRFTSSPNKHES